MSRPKTPVALVTAPSSTQPVDASVRKASIMSKQRAATDPWMRRGSQPRATVAAWHKSLRTVRAAAISRVANHGLGSNAVEALLLSDLCNSGAGVGALLVPGLADMADVPSFSDDAMHWVNQMIDAAFLYGVIAGTGTSWEMVEAVEPPAGEKGAAWTGRKRRHDQAKGGAA
jgi:hypothetical protein